MSKQSDGWMLNHIDEHCFLGNIPKKLPPIIIIFAFYIISQVHSYIFDEISTARLIGDGITLVLMSFGLYFLALRLSWEIQAKVVFISLKGMFGVMGLILVSLSLREVINSEYSTLLPLLLIGLIILPIWEFVFSLYRHHGKLTLFRVISVLSLGAFYS